MERKKKISTKQRIINEAIRLYNEQGAHNITSRHIAAELGMSHGNLDYHYKNREAILLAIYKQMRKEMGASYEIATGSTSSFADFHKLLLHLEAFQFKYRFFNQDVLEISRSYPEVSQLLKETIGLRNKQMADFFERFKKEGLVDNEIDTYAERLKKTIRIIITFWLAQREVLGNPADNLEGEMAHHIWELITPHMTSEGKTVFKAVVDQYGYRYDG
ncbi:TetR/AcrR family transcriptional regulator [Echinicola vietnamensis]|uniref:Transcriptional regulator n=1 Tax=Echinicola vietnamensis (strain DSM 17526 / LMG 23754 / KMM 6221) TaxID=926556 RepID=L0FWY7_ECHVK|nr:TetR/AcrR family transcriptional regulator [Echinicola vietnamensis]AGA77528.1 transcriptional regulator [Echinicola vietnamensis DSM 17526]